MPSASHIRLRAAAFLALLLLTLAAWAASPIDSGAAPDTGSVQSQLDDARSRESSLSGQVASLDSVLSRLSSSIGTLERRLASKQAELTRREAELAKLQKALTRERKRLGALRKRLAYTRKVLGRRLRETYKSGRPDIITVILQADGFTDLLERGELLKRIHRQDVEIIDHVRVARDQSKRAAKRMAILEKRARLLTDALRLQRDALARVRGVLAARRASLAGARAARAAALRNAKSGRRKLQSQLDKLKAEQAQQSEQSGSPSFSGPLAGPGSGGGGWAIPYAIVMCESGGYNHPPNYAGASGYYQIIPSTWRGFGGRGPAAWLASRSEQDRVARLIWNGGRGARNWVCFSLVN